MNKVITINLNGVAYQVEEGGFDALRVYLDTAGRRLEGNPDRDEILADIEQAIADKFRSLLGVSKTVIVTKEATDIIAGMGPVEDASGSSEASHAASGSQATGAQGTPRTASAPGSAAVPPKRLYKIREGAKMGGVCNGIAAYLNVDVTIIRVVFAVLMLAYGTGFVIYFLLMFILPEANTPEEVAEAHGAPSATAQEFIRRAKEGYYDGMKTFGDRRAHREWKRKFKREMRGWKQDFHREMHQSAAKWRSTWNDHWSQPGVPPGGLYAHSFLGLLLGLLTLLCVCTVLSLIFTGGVFGLFFPGIPLWLTIVLVIVFFKMVKWPVRAMRYPYGYGWHGCGPCGFIWHVLMWVGLVYFILWMTGGHMAGMHEIGQHLPHKLHNAAHSLKEWWEQQ